MAGRDDALWPRQSPRLTRRSVLSVFFVLLVIALSLAIIWIFVVGRAAAKPPCTPTIPCSYPPRQHVSGERTFSPRDATPVVRTWTSDSGVRLRYDATWRVVTSGADELKLIEKDGKHVGLLIRAVPSTQMSPLQVLNDQLRRYGRDKLGLKLDTDSDHALLDPRIGSVKAVGAVYAASQDDQPSPSAPVEVLLEAASDGRTTVLIAASTDTDAEGAVDAATPFPIFRLVDLLLTAFDWPPR